MHNVCVTDLAVQVDTRLTNGVYWMNILALGERHCHQEIWKIEKLIGNRHRANSTLGIMFMILYGFLLRSDL